MTTSPHHPQLKDKLGLIPVAFPRMVPTSHLGSPQNLLNRILGLPSDSRTWSPGAGVWWGSKNLYLSFFQGLGQFSLARHV